MKRLVTALIMVAAAAAWAEETPGTESAANASAFEVGMANDTSTADLTASAVDILNADAEKSAPVFTDTAANSKTRATGLEDESKIPVLTGKKDKSAAATNPFGRLLLSLGVIVCLAAGLVYFSRWWQQRHGKSLDNNRIRVLTQHHLGPKKSLAIIRVAGESILIGITDHNISMIKSLALLEDEEVPTNVPARFADELQRTSSDEAEEDSPFAQIRDKIAGKIKEMRPL